MPRHSNLRLVSSNNNPQTLREHLRRVVARHLARKLARQHGHALEPFRLGGGVGYELAFCRDCRAGVSLHLGTGALSASRDLEEPCPSGTVQ